MVLLSAKWMLLSSLVSLAALQSTGGQGDFQEETDRNGQGRNLLDWIGLGTGPDTDPYLARTNGACLNGDLAECFKSRALSSLDDFFDQHSYQVTDYARIRRMPTPQLRALAQEPFEFSSAPRSEDSEWDQLVKFALRKVEKFLKSTAIEVEMDDEITDGGRYSPRFIDEISDEIDIIEDKKDSLFKRKQLKKLFIPMLIILKLFKLKLLLFLPLILGLASFKKFLGFLAIAIPGIIGFYKFCKPNLQSNGYYGTPSYSPAGIGYQHHFREPQPSFANHEYHESPHRGGGVHFGDESHAQNLAYNGWGQYRNGGGAGKEIEAETSSKKSILPDS